MEKTEELVVKRAEWSNLTADDLKRMQADTRAEGRCGSLQTSNGLPCRKWVSAGYTVCRTHGARAPATMAKAERALAAARMPAIYALMNILDQWSEDTCEACGYPRRADTDTQRTILSTAKVILDRTGFGPKATLEVNARRTEDQDLPIDQMTEVELIILQGVYRELQCLKEQVRSRLANIPKVIDVTPVED